MNNQKQCFYCKSGTKYMPITNKKGEIISLHSICQNPKCSVNLTMLALKKRKSSLRSKQTFKTSKPKSRLLKGMLVTLVSAALSYSACIGLANADFTSNTVTFQQTVPSISTSTTSKKTDTVTVEKSETIKEKILKYALKYDVDPRELENIVLCETGASDVNKASTTIRSRYLEGTPRHEKSWGLAQIHVSKVNVTYEQAIDPDFALDYLAKNWKAGNQWMWKNCSVKYGYI